jgi:hypothetical protein
VTAGRRAITTTITKPRDGTRTNTANGNRLNKNYSKINSLLKEQLVNCKRMKNNVLFSLILALTPSAGIVVHKPARFPRLVESYALVLPA